MKEDKEYWIEKVRILYTENQKLRCKILELEERIRKIEALAAEK